ncbi:glycosyltransferase [Myroides fluvii]|uniref:glycosyltransferase n=1 Tax=Myroides fluvii TaxID=2572594 RepID=UPI00131D3E23|nr:glycosyltransferase [Myroides fluvii]
MLSIVIPVYNYNILPLVEQLHREAFSLNIPFELLVCDDASTQVYHPEQLEAFPYLRWFSNPVNQHVAYTRNRLLKTAQYPWVLLLDADVMPVSTTFIQQYLEQRNKGYFFQGGFTYPLSTASTKRSLRFVYGSEIEQHKHLHSCCNLFFNQRELQLQFDEEITEYGYEDTLFFFALQKRGIDVTRLNNPVIHHSTESNQTYLNRSTQACWGLAQLVEQGKIKTAEVQLSRVYSQLEKARISPLLYGINWLLKRPIQRNLLGKNPSMPVFKLFKLLEFHKAKVAIRKSKSTAVTP